MQRHKKYLIVTIWISTIAFIGAGFVGWGQYSYGDKSSGTKGLGYRMGETEKYIERDKKLKWTIAGFALAIKGAVIYIIYKIW